MTPVVILGSTGMLGSGVVDFLASKEIEVIESNRSGVCFNPLNKAIKFDILKDNISKLINYIPKDSLIVNLSGVIRHKILRFDEVNVENVKRINTDFPLELVNKAAERNCRVLQIGTDCVFSGRSGKYHEKSARHPVDLYGLSKDKGETSAPNLMTIRVSVVGKERHSNIGLLSWVLGQPNGAAIVGYENHYWNGVTTLQLGKVIFGVMNDGFISGTYHLVPTNQVSKHQLISSIASLSRRNDINIEGIKHEKTIDRTLSTQFPEINRGMWLGAGYSTRPTINQMLQEYFDWLNKKGEMALTKRIDHNSVITITGGTGSFGQTMAKDLLASGVKEIRVFSRDENKQETMRNSFRDERLRFFLGDVRDFDSVKAAIEGSNFVFHSAALKQVPSCEFFPMQAVSTNVVGSSNVIRASIQSEVESVVCLSTDKAVYPINAMGMSKAIMEKIAQSFARSSGESRTRISITRYGNVMMSRGSVIPLFLGQILDKKPITLTDPKMTRFLMSLSESVDLVKYAFENGSGGDVFVRKAPGSTVSILIDALLLLTESSKREVRRIGIRHGEKMHESLLSAEEMNRAVDCNEYFRIPLDSRSLDYQIYFDQGLEAKAESEAYTSENTLQLTADQVARKISELPEYIEFQERLKK